MYSVREASAFIILERQSAVDLEAWRLIPIGQCNFVGRRKPRFLTQCPSLPHQNLYCHRNAFYHPKHVPTDTSW